MLARDKAVRSRLLIYVALPVSYAITGWLGLFLALPPGYATPIFLPAGIALTATFIAGSVSLPSVFAGSLILNAWVGYSISHRGDLIEVAAAIAIAAASTFQAYIGSSALRRFVGYPASLDTLRDILSYVVAIPLICATSATFSVGSLWALGIVQSDALLSHWLTWWCGDSLGVLVALPLMLIFFGAPRVIWRYRGAQVAIPMLISFGIFVIIFVRFQSWSVLTVGGLGTGLLGAFLLLMTGQAYRLLIADREKQQLASIVESSDDAIVSIDLKGIIVSWNNGAERFFGHSAEEAIGKPITIVIPPELEEEKNKVLASIQREERLEHYETKRRHKDGRIIDVSLTVSPVKNNQGEIVGASKIARDITERKQAQERIAADFRALTRINQLSGELMRESAELQKCLSEILDIAIELSGADMGNIQLLDQASGGLTITAQRGFKEPFLTFFALVCGDDNSACAAAIHAHNRIVVEDVVKSEIFVGKSSQKILLDAGVRAVISIPLISSNGSLLGMISTHFGKIYRPSARELSWMDLLARQAADFLHRKRAEEIEKTLVHEVQHRGNNLLSVVQAIVHRALSDKSSLADAKSAIEGRLQSLARANRQLTGTKSERTSIDEIIRMELEPFQQRTSLRGNSVRLDPQIAQRLSLAIHELATNAAKYGAFSNGAGKVEVSWAPDVDGEERCLKFKWREHGGPPVTAPTVSGFGTTLLKTTFKDVQFNYAPDGLTCDITIPFNKLDAG